MTRGPFHYADMSHSFPPLLAPASKDVRDRCKPQPNDKCLPP